MKFGKPGVILLTSAMLSSLLNAATNSFDYGRIYTLTNSSITVKVAPRVGRVTHFGFSSGKNVLWLEDRAKLTKKETNSWQNIGGDKVWPAQQADWNFIYGKGSWPPATELDRAPFKVIYFDPHRLVMESATDSHLHIALRRTITVDANAARVTILNSLMQKTATPWPVQIWSVTQCRPPEYCLLGIDGHAPDRDTRPFKNLWDAPLPKANATIIGPRALRFALSDELTIGKVGTIGSFCAAVYDDTIFLQISDAPVDGCYPDGANLEVFSFDRYTELEVLSPARHLTPGESITSATTWQLIRKSPTDSAAIVMKTIKANPELEKTAAARTRAAKKHLNDLQIINRKISVEEI